jgi:hypothetical protein
LYLCYYSKRGKRPENNGEEEEEKKKREKRERNINIKKTEVRDNDQLVMLIFIFFGGKGKDIHFTSDCVLENDIVLVPTNFYGNSICKNRLRDIKQLPCIDDRITYQHILYRFQ